VLKRLHDAERITEREHRQVRILADQDELTITWSRSALGERGPDLHVRREHTDAFYVLDGELTFELGPGAEPVRVPAGGSVAIPPNVAHSFGNEGSVDARWLNLHAPNKGFAPYMRALRDGTDATFDSFHPPADGGRPADEVILAGPGEGERLVTGNRVVLLKVVLPDLCLAEWTLDGPFDGPDVHRHDRQVDAFYVIDGGLEVTMEGSAHAIGPDTLAAVPRGVSHTFAHTGSRVLNVHAPDGGFADFMRRSAASSRRP
jgi:mannose-6-phosphate isomerase-like protein (cupin superfamily)